jgi:transposase-like protein
MDTYTQPVTTKRQYRTLEEKQRIVGEALAAGASVARVARAHGVNANLVFNWCRLYRAGRLRRRSEANCCRYESLKRVALCRRRHGLNLVACSPPRRARFTSNCSMRKCGSKARPIQCCCVCCWSVCSDDRAARQHANLDCRRGH